MEKTNLEITNDLLQKRFNEMQRTMMLFRSKISGDRLWEVYLENFEKDPIYRDPSSSVHRCNSCANFFHRYGNIVAIDEKNGYKIMTIFDYATDVPEYGPSLKACADLLKNSKIDSVFVETYDFLNTQTNYQHCTKNLAYFALGLAQNKKIYTEGESKKFGVVKAGQVYTYHHFHLNIDKSFIDMSGDSVGSISGKYNIRREMLKTTMNLIEPDTYQLVIDLINQGSLLNAEQHKTKLEYMKKFKENFDKIDRNQQENWTWVESYNVKYPGFKNELIGTLCISLAEGEELNTACKEYNMRADPYNYMKAKAPITKTMINNAKKFIDENGYEESFNRRCATIDDIKASDILHIDSGDGKIKPVSIFDGLTPTITRHKKSEFDKVEEVDIEKFMKDILPGCTSVEAYVENRMKNNFVTLTTSVDKNSKPIFEWPNNFSWTYNGNLAGKSQIKTAVKEKGGKVDAPFRVSLMWNLDGRASNCDLDIHLTEPGRYDVYFANHQKKYGNPKSPFGAWLDLDTICPGNDAAVENLYYEDLTRLRDGVYKIWVNNFNGGNNVGCKVEIYFEGQTFEYIVPNKIIVNVEIARIHIKEKQIAKIDQSKYFIGGDEIQTTIWGIKTGEFHKVNLVCLSPNYWEGGVGNKHYFFMLDDCKNPDKKLRSFHIENLKPELRQHRKVFEVLANQLMVDSTDNQLSGLGFNATVRDSIVLRLKGSFKRVIRVKF